ncbi:MAG: DUF4347 domain-containing protein, partial [Spirulina sp. SIO3F2]|nr:DUF4347 domain-containing protein [Spirulina sp. SIO3F2]
MPRSLHPELPLRPFVWTASFLLSSSPLFTLPSGARSLTVAPDGTGTIITIDGQTYHIGGGTQAGANLFHSFQEFGLSPGEIANFLSDPSIVNILGRVTGGNPSIIDGRLQVSGSNANLYLMNPAGMVFGPNASLNVSGDFFATTADRIGFEEGWFNATGANDYTTLVGMPNQFAFLHEKPSAILNQGNLHTDQDLSLIGGAVHNQGEIISTHGNVTLAAVPGTRLVNLAQPGMLLSLDLPATALEQGVSPLDLPELLTGSSQGNSPVIALDPVGVSTGALPLQNPNHHRASIFPGQIEPGDVVIAGTVTGQQVDLYAAGQITPSDPSLVQGKTRVIRFSEMGENPEQAVFIDRRADHPEDLLYGAAPGTIAQIIEPDEDGVAVITEQLAVSSESVGELDSVAIVAEGNAGNFWLGNQWITAENITGYQQQLQTWGSTLTENADILLYSCFTALGATGEELIASIADFTGADVAASIDATGSANYGGNWYLESSSGAIEASNPFLPGTVANWDGKLAIRTVTSNADAGAGTLRDALTIGAGFGGGLAAGDTVNFNFSGTITLTGTEINWTADNVTVDGLGQSIVVDGGGNSRVFNIGANNATVQNLTIQNGTFIGKGGGIRHTGAGTLTLSGVTVSNNSSSLSGGGINNNGRIELINSTVSGNSSNNRAGGIRSGGAVTLINSTITNNSANNNGGGIFTRYGVTLHNSTVSSNSTVGIGAGIRSSLTVNLFSSSVIGNSGTSAGGGIFDDDGVNLNNSTVANNIANAKGGGIFSNSLVTVTNSTVSGNSASNHGGGIYTTGAVTVSGATIANNTSGLRGGGLYSQGNTTIANSTIASNIAAVQGGGIFMTGSNLSLNMTNSRIQNNRALTGSDGGMAGFVGTGGAVTVESSIIRVTALASIRGAYLLKA